MGTFRRSITFRSANGGNDRYWHESEVPPLLAYVRYPGKTSEIAPVIDAAKASGAAALNVLATPLTPEETLSRRHSRMECYGISLELLKLFGFDACCLDDRRPARDLARDQGSKRLWAAL